MTIKELRKMFTKRVEHLCEPSLKGYYEVCWGALETLYEVGELNVRKNYYIPDEIMSLAHAYESGRKIKGFTVVQCLDLMYIYATKKQARDLMGMFLGIETEQTAKPEPEQLEETESEVPEQETDETAKDAEPKNTNDKSHTALQEGLNPTRVFYKGEWRVLVLFLPIKVGHDFADRCEIKALPERNYEDIATSLENGKHGFSEWYLYDPETTCKRLKRYQDTAMKKFTAKTGVQVLEAELNRPERKAVVYGHDKNGIPIQSGVIPLQELGETLTDYEAKCADSDFFIYDPDTGKYDVLREHPPKRFMKMFPELGGAVA